MVTSTPPVRPTLYPFQVQAVAEILAAWKDGQAPLLVIPTGGGKTVITAELIDIILRAAEASR